MKRNMRTATTSRKWPWLSTRQVAERLNVSLRTVQAWHKSDFLKAVKVGGRLRFNPQDVEAMVLGQRVTVVSGLEDPLLGELWDNNADAAYDQL
jgi:excisionase family DNA binding protein